MLLFVHMQKIAKGSWDGITSWEFFLDTVEPPLAFCTAVACVGFTEDLQRVVLTRSHRGWEIVGGHIEEGEAIADTLIRESLEEGGFMPVNYQLFGHRRLTSTEPVPHNQHPGKFYPHPHSYVPYFVAIVAETLAPITGEEIYESRTFELDELADYLDEHQLVVIHAARDFLA